MPTDDTAQRLAEIVKTTRQKQQLISQIEDLLSDLAKVNPPSLASIQKNYPIVYKILMEQHPEPSNIITQEKLGKLKEALENLEELMLNAPSMTSDNIAQIAHLWCKENVDPTALVNIIPSEKLTAGVTCSYKGQYRDFSLDKIVHHKIYA